MAISDKKRKLYHLPVRLGVTILFVLSLLGFVFCALGAVYFDRIPASKDVEYKQSEKMLAEHYSAYVLSQLGTDESPANLPLVENSNFNYAIVKGNSSQIQDIDLNDEASYLVGGPEDSDKYSYVFTALKGDSFYYQMNGIGLANIMEYRAFSYNDSEYENQQVLSVKSVAYSEKTGIFYFETEEGYFRIPMIRVDGSKLYSPTTNLSREAWSRKFMETGEDGSELTGYYYNAFTLTENNGSYTYVGENGDIFDPSMDLDQCTLYFMDKDDNCVSYFNIQFEGDQWEITDYYNSELQVVAFDIESACKMYQDQDFSYNGDGQISCRRDLSKDVYYHVLSWVNNPLDSSRDDRFTATSEFLNHFYGIGSCLIWLQIVFAVLTIGFFLLYVMVVGHRPEDDQIHVTFWEKIPFEIHTLVCLTAGAVLIACADQVVGEVTTLPIIIIICLETCVLASVICMAWLSTLIVRIKAHCFWRNTLCYYLAIPFRNAWNKLKLLLPGEEHFALMTLGLVLLVDFVEILIFLICDYIAIEAGILWVLFSVFLQSILIIYIALQVQKLRLGARNLAEGNMEDKINTVPLKWVFRKHAEDINQISDNISAAVSQQLRSERMRTELITNVSHDIKTPLTSIINYVDLIKKEDIDNPQALEYIEVLDRQSNKLKKLIQDLLDASKASTGNLEVNLEKTDAAVLLSQAVGEFGEKMEKQHLQLLVSSPEPPVEIMADGRHLWRVFDNLLGNICKYAMPGTRVYITLTQNEKETLFVFRNISAEPLNISSEELMERFVRGDGSRNSEGNGLGLSIAQSLMRLMGGELYLDIDGDLFKATLRFPG